MTKKIKTATLVGNANGSIRRGFAFFDFFSLPDFASLCILRTLRIVWSGPEAIRIMIVKKAAQSIVRTNKMIVHEMPSQAPRAANIFTSPNPPPPRRAGAKRSKNPTTKPAIDHSPIPNT